MTPRPSGHVLERPSKRHGTVYAIKTRVPGRVPEQTTTRLGPKHNGRGRPPAGHYTRRMAEDALNDYLAAARRGEHATAGETKAVTFAQAAEEYLRYVEQEKGCQPSTLKDYRGVIRDYLNPRFGHRAIDQLTSEEINAYKLDLLNERRLSNRTIVRHLLVLNGVFVRAQVVWDLPSNPASGRHVIRPKVQYTGEFDMLTREQLAALCRAAESPQDATLYLTAAMTGLRQGELRALTWADVDFATERIHVRRSATTGARPVVKAPKSGRVRSVPMVPQVAEALARLGMRDDLVFGNPIGQVENDTLLRRRYMRAVKKAGLPPVRFHDLRHVFGSTAVRSFPLSDVQAMLGHAHVTTTARYIHYRPGAEDARRLADAFGAGAETPVQEDVNA
jgi:integrase